MTSPDANATADREDLKSRTLSSILWSVLRVGWSTLATFLIFVVLARLLQPEAFGVFALASLCFEVGRIIANGGLPDAVMREHTLDEELADTAFWANLALSITIAGTVFLLAPLYERWTQMTGVAELLRWLCLLMPVAALGSIHTARIAREFGHQNLAKQALIVSTAAGLGAVLAAYYGFGVQSLLVQAALTNVLGTLLAWYYFRWMPQRRFSVARLRQAATFSAGMMATQLLWVLMVRVQDLFISRSHGAAAVGQYRVAWRTIELIGQVVLAPIGSVSLITLSKIQHQPEAFAAAYRRLIGGASLIGFPLLFGFGAIAEELITLVFGTQWVGTGAIAEVLVFMAVPFVLNYISGPALAAINRSWTVLAISTLQLVCTVVLTWIAVPYGLVAVALAYVLRAYLTAPFQQLALCRSVGTGTATSLESIPTPLVLSLAMAGAVWLTKPFLAAELGHGATLVFVSVLLGATLYGLGIATFARAAAVPYLRPLKALLLRHRHQ